MLKESSNTHEDKTQAIEFIKEVYESGKSCFDIQIVTR